MSVENGFDKLLDALQGDIDTMAKAMGDDDGDDKVAAAAGDDEAAKAAAAAEGDDDDAGDGDDDDDGDEMGKGGAGGDATMSKSFTMKLEDGTEVEAIDGTELVKSLMARFEKHESATTEREDKLAKALESAVTLIKSLAGQVQALKDQPRGRKAVVSITEKPAAGQQLAKSDSAADGPTVNDVMTKALSLQADGRLNGLDISRAEAFLNRGLPLPEDFVRRVMQ